MHPDVILYSYKCTKTILFRNYYKINSQKCTKQMTHHFQVLIYVQHLLFIFNPKFIALQHLLIRDSFNHKFITLQHLLITDSFNHKFITLHSFLKKLLISYKNMPTEVRFEEKNKKTVCSKIQGHRNQVK